MLHIFYGRETIDKEAFLYDRIGQTGGRTFVIVPDQYTLEAEKQAFRLLHVRGLMDVEITSLSRLGSRLLAATGDDRTTFIDRHGRHMLLAQVLAEKKEELQVFGGHLRKTAFIEMTSDFITEMKQYDITPEELARMAAELEPDSLLARKLADMQVIFAAYQARISGKYTDNEDRMDLYRARIAESEMIRNSQIWVYGFDSFSPKVLTVLGQLMASAADLHVFLTYDRNCRDEDLFRLSGIVMDRLRRQAEEHGVAVQAQKVSDAYAVQKSGQAIRVLERELFAVDIRPETETDDSVVLCEAANVYSEAESAAAFILHLLRDRQMRYRDLVVICNDPTVRGAVIRRVFEESGIRLFDDRVRTILHSPIALFVVSLLETVAGRYRTQDVFRTLKTGFSPLSDDGIEMLENYAIQYRIKGSLWKRPFVRGQKDYGEDGLAALNELRRQAMELFAGAEEICRQAADVDTFIRRYYDFLMERVHLGDAILALADRQEAAGLLDLAEETTQIWGKIVGVLDQMAELMGTQKFVLRECIDLLTVGLSQLSVGVLPPTADDMLMGTIQRTRSGAVRALIVIGANEGLLPAIPTDEGLFSIDELEFLAAQGAEICKLDQVRAMEERLAIYHNLCKPSDVLWIGYAVSDSDGKECRPSEIVETIRRIFPNLKKEADVVTRGEIRELVGGQVRTLRHLTQAMQQSRRGEPVDPGWRIVRDWYRTRMPAQLRSVEQGLAFRNVPTALPRELAQTLYQRPDSDLLVLSPTRLERFSRCPFAFFVQSGLRPLEYRPFAADSREIGDIYHQCLMELSRKLTRERRWDTVTREECRDFIEEIAAREMAAYREGIFRYGGEERYRAHRIVDNCLCVCWALVTQVRAGEIRESLYEVPFGRDRKLPPICVETDGRQIRIEGKIDRMDLLPGDRVKIIDYKTGKEKFKISEARGGYRLQLMLYLKAAQVQNRKPAGVFYFLIDDPQVDLTGVTGEKVAERLAAEVGKAFRLDGILVSDAQVIRNVAGDFHGYSDIVPLYNGKEGIRGNTDGILLSDEGFAELQADVDRQVETLCRALVAGDISIRPKKASSGTACDYCGFKGICRFDRDFAGCRHEIVP